MARDQLFPSNIMIGFRAEYTSGELKPDGEEVVESGWFDRKSQRRYRLKFADSYYGELNHYGMYWLRWADVRR